MTTIRRPVLAGLMLAASLVVFAGLATTGRGATYAVMTASPILVVVLAAMIRRSASGVPRAVCLVTAVDSLWSDRGA